VKIVATKRARAQPAVDSFVFAATLSPIASQLAPEDGLSVNARQAMLAPRAMPPVEIVPKEGVFDYAARYTAGATDYFCPARLDARTLDAAGAVALAAHRVLGLRDLSRTDLIVDAAGTPWFLEVNVAPGMTETSMLPMAVAEAGLDLGTVCLDLLVAATGRP